jgi:hypothetical protein
MDDVVHCLMVTITLLLFKLDPFYAPPHTPATANGTAGAEQFFQIMPPFGCDWMKYKVSCG